MNPAETYAALKLLEAALRPALAQAAADAETYRQAVGAKSLESPYGDVSITRRKPALIVTDDDALIAWCEDELPNLVRRSITPEARTWLLSKRFALSDDGDPIDPATGEIVPFLAATPGAEYLTWRAKPETKAAAAAAIAERLEAVTAAILPTP